MIKNDNNSMTSLRQVSDFEFCLAGTMIHVISSINPFQTRKRSGARGKRAIAATIQHRAFLPDFS
ncbi:hypothetical protein SINU_08640 [Sporolactobacillus inulinus CASD]|uniref:Uncharacterized protein n=1 Tax=Sporolactobacillus inulinus CASD TaxID=1069536 RepID=A0A0U1QNE4_9BACL|nr:hypothetical protein SINU_08640 [Sporolactobacillus inulinus CASD]